MSSGGRSGRANRYFVETVEWTGAYLWIEIYNNVRIVRVVF